jgi:hypothetical protein
VIVKFDLLKPSAVKARFGRAEVAMIINHIIGVAHELDKGLVSVQKIIVLLSIFYMCSRPSTLGPCHKMFLDEGRVSSISIRVMSHDSSFRQYPRLRDILTIEHRKAYDFALRIDLNNFKVRGVPYAIHVCSRILTYNQAHNIGVGKDQVWNVSEVKYGHNVLFDLPMWMVIYLLGRGVLKQKVRSPPHYRLSAHEPLDHGRCQVRRCVPRDP